MGIAKAFYSVNVTAPIANENTPNPVVLVQTDSNGGAVKAKLTPRAAKESYTFEDINTLPLYMSGKACDLLITGQLNYLKMLIKSLPRNNAMYTSCSESIATLNLMKSNVGSTLTELADEGGGNKSRVVYNK